jgi:hypothetical protein
MDCSSSKRSDAAKHHPHHKHILPDIKHHRIPAPEMSFVKPHPPILIREIEAILFIDKAK